MRESNFLTTDDVFECYYRVVEKRMRWFLHGSEEVDAATVKFGPSLIDSVHMRTGNAPISEFILFMCHRYVVVALTPILQVNLWP